MRTSGVLKYKRSHSFVQFQRKTERTNEYASMRSRTKLKEMHIVRYADDFKIFTRDYQTAKRTFEAVKLWLKERLDLDISPEKSKITNLKRNYTVFLGFKLKVIPKGKKMVVKSHISDKPSGRLSIHFWSK